MQSSNEMKYIDVESEYKQFVEDFVSFLKEQSEKYNKPTLCEKYEYLKNKLLELKAKHPIIGDIRGRGLMLGCEFVDPTGKPDAIGSFPASGEIAAAVQKKRFENKLIMEKGGRFGSVMRCLCALTVTKEEIDTMLSIFEKSIKEVESCGK